MTALALIALAGLTAGCATATSPGEFVTYTDEVNGFSISHPVDWEESPEMMYGATQVAFCEPGFLREADASVLVDKYTLFSETSLESGYEDYKDPMYLEADRFITRSEKSTLVSGVPAVRFLWEVRDDEIEMKWAGIYLVQGDAEWIVTIVCLAESFASFEPTFDTIASSFELLETAPPAETEVPAAAPVPPPVGRIAFASDRDGNMEIYVMSADGTTQRLTDDSFYDGQPAWSPDGTTIAFVSDRDGNDEIYVMNADGTDQTRITDNSYDDSWPAWSPDGTRIAFTSGRDGNDEIYVMNADGADQTRITDNPNDDWGPAWSPDGALIAFASEGDDSYEIWVMTADGGNLTNLTNTRWPHETSPAWSPDGTRIAFTSDRDSDCREIWVADADGANQTRLTHYSYYNCSRPAWSPDGAMIAFQFDKANVSDFSHQYEICVMNADGTDWTSTYLTVKDPADMWPSWTW